MFWKFLFVCLVAVYLVQPNEAILDTIILNVAAVMAINDNITAQTALAQTLATLTGLQTSTQITPNSLYDPLVSTLKNVISHEVNSTGGDPSKVNTCFNTYIGLVQNYQTTGANFIVGVCEANITEAISHVNTASGLANNLTNTVVNANHIMAVACPAFRDLYSSIKKPFCEAIIFYAIFVEVKFQTARLSEYVNKTTTFAKSVAASTSALSMQACANDQILKLATDALPAMEPILQCAV